jgi:hypothetical protein
MAKVSKAPLAFYPASQAIRRLGINRGIFFDRTFPGRAPQFLNDASARFLLRRVGGGYSFVHRLLLDHLASREAVAMLEQTAPE